MQKWHAFDGVRIDLRSSAQIAFRWKERGEFFDQEEYLDAPFELVFRLVGYSPGEALQSDNSTLVKFTLGSQGDKTRICLVESGFADLAQPWDGDVTKAAISLQGWRNGLSVLAALALHE
jgi:hypothetical protein